MISMPPHILAGTLGEHPEVITNYFHFFHSSIMIYPNRPNPPTQTTPAKPADSGSKVHVVLA